MDNLNAMHYFIDQIAFQTEMRGPLFKCEPNNDGSLRLHYYSMRNGLFPMVKGLVWQSAKALFDIKVKITVMERTQEKRNNVLTEHVIFNIESIDDSVALVSSNALTMNLLQLNLSGTKPPPGISLQSFSKMFPFHICINKQMIIEHCGEFLQHELNLNKRKMTKLTEIFNLIQPEDVQLSFKGLVTYLNSLFIFQLKPSLSRNGKNNSIQHHPLYLKGMFICLQNLSLI